MTISLFTLSVYSVSVAKSLEMHTNIDVPVIQVIDTVINGPLGNMPYIHITKCIHLLVHCVHVIYLHWRFALNAMLLTL